MAVICAILCVGLLFLEVSVAVLVAFLISFLDMLPFFGTGTALIPWAVFKLLSGDTKFAVEMCIRDRRRPIEGRSKRLVGEKMR